MAEIEPLLEKQFGDWKAPAAALTTKMLATVALPSAPRLVLVNKTGAEQSLIMAAELAPPKSDPDDLAMQLAATTLGGNFVSRLNMNLREDKHWSYGAFASIGGTKAQRPFIAYAPVQTDKTSESMTQIRNELDAAIGKRSEEHTSELQSLMRISYAVFCLKKKSNNKILRITITNTQYQHQHS